MVGILHAVLPLGLSVCLSGLVWRAGRVGNVGPAALLPTAAHIGGVRAAGRAGLGWA